MKILARLILILVAGVVRAEDTLESKLPIVVASVQFNIGEPPARVVLCAQALASQMFAKANVRLVWHTRPPGGDQKAPQIFIDIAPYVPEVFHRGALAYARTFEGVHITIFWDRFEAIRDTGTKTALLAHVLVHEVTHILQGTSRHSTVGIMKAHWTADDIYRMARDPLPLDSVDIELIHLGLAVRSNARALTSRTPPTSVH